jgi:hypothetical protein
LAEAIPIRLTTTAVQAQHTELISIKKGNEGGNASLTIAGAGNPTLDECNGGIELR